VLGGHKYAMDASELRALLEAAARELGSVTSGLCDNDATDEATMRIAGELADAQEAIREAVTACGVGTSSLEQEPSEVLREARALRSEAVRARDVAESRLWTLQDEHAELLERLQELSGQQQQRLEEQHKEADIAASRETVLVERCRQLDNEVRGLRKEVDAKSQRLIASTALGHSLELTKRKLQRQHEGSLAENAVAREILALQQSTEAYLHWVGDECSKVDQSLDLAHKRCAEQMEGLQSEWSEQQAKYKVDMASLEDQLQNLQREYEERWEATEKSARQVINTRSQQANAARQKVEAEIQRCDEEREKEAIASRELLEEHNQMMSDARQAAMCKMEANLQARRHDMEEQVAAEQRRNETLRNRYNRRSVDCHQEVLHYKRNIEELRFGYHARSSLTPRRQLGSAVMPRSSWRGDGIGMRRAAEMIATMD